ncbi:hypothetical protein [Nocardia aurantia]|uniref:LGFP repeat-containing protein n=1 Tax=Nocardia aurantia TaxID=2585199 RepID=A0A7K0DLV8_9NOCA|nr:hypothetical protein [Nocardia aurantia]MQY26292.1 hypothetical protein [Nocardia aurantia]
MSSLSRKALSGFATGLLTVGLLGGTALAQPGVPAPGPPPEATGAIDSHYNELGGASSILGQPDGDAAQVANGAMQNYRGGTIFYSPGTGAQAVYGDILNRYRDLGGPTGELGFPTGDETDAGDGVGRVENFAEAGGAAIYWSPSTGAHMIKDRVLDAYRSSGGVTGPFGYPTTDMTDENGVQASSFAGPTGTEIRWSQADGISTVPANLAASLTAQAPQPPAAGPTPPIAAPPPAVNSSGNSGINRWWGVPIGLAIAAAVGALLGLLGRRPAPRPEEHPLRREEHPLRTAMEPTVRTAAPEPRRSAFETPRPAAPGMRAGYPPRSEFDTPRTGFDMPRAGATPPAGRAPRDVPASPQTRRGAAEPVVHQRPASEVGGVEVVYENNAVGAGQRSHTDKSDPGPGGPGTRRR